MNSSDIWPKYWLAYFKTEKARQSNGKSDYVASIKEWEKFLREEAAYASPVLIYAYKIISFCYSKIGNKEQENIYLKKVENLKHCFSFDSMDVYYFGY